MQVWAVPPKKMQCEWLGERVATVDITRAISNVINNKEDAGWGPNAVFRLVPALLLSSWQEVSLAAEPHAPVFGRMKAVVVCPAVSLSKLDCCSFAFAAQASRWSFGSAKASWRWLPVKIGLL